MAFFQFIETKGWKRVAARMNGWGASVVIIGALFKLQHWPGAGYMLTVGMGVECLLFFISGFDPLPAEYHWDILFPELTGNGGHGVSHRSVKSPVAVQGSQIAQQGEAQMVGQQFVGQQGFVHGAQIAQDGHGYGMDGLDIGSDSSKSLKKNIDRFNQSVSNLSNLSTIADTTNQFIEELQQAADNMTVLNQATQAFAAAYDETAQTITSGGQQANVNLSTLNQSSQTLASTYNETAGAISEGGQQVVSNLTVLSQSAQAYAGIYSETAKAISMGGQQASSSLATLNKNLQAVNTSYELYIQEHKGYISHSQNLLTAMSNSASQSQQFDRQMIELNKLIAELTTVYTSVVHTVNTTLKKR
jgi:gliding motility-associated protein GldL